MAPLEEEIPTGTVTFLFTDIEGSTRLLQDLGGSTFSEVVQEHHEVLRAAIRDSQGVDIGTEGDSFFAVFKTAPAAAAAAAKAQRDLASRAWPSPVRVRMGIHTGEGTRGGDSYVGLDVHIAARIASAAHGGQILISDATRALVQDELPDSSNLIDLGEHRLKDLARPHKIFQLALEGLPSEFPAIKSLGNRPNNLPGQLTSFVGRSRELMQLKELLPAARCLSLTGPGGTGKTRLSLELAREVSDEFANGTFFVQLASLTEPSMVAPTIASTLHLPETRGEARSAQERLIEHLSGKEMLLVLDNFEQLVGGAPVVSELLANSDRLRVVVTTRVPLHIQGEREYPVPPLVLPDPKDPPDAERVSQYESVALFIDRAVGVKPDFKVTNQNAPAIAEICARLDGLPLAIELAAARVRVLTPEALLARLGDRLKLLVGGATDIPQRQQTLRGAIEWSYELLNEEEQRLFRRFSVFVDGCRLEEAELVCGSADLGIEVFDGISSLIDKSLVKTDESEPTELRFLMLETIRDYAQQKLEETDERQEIHSKHAQAYTQLGEAAAPQVFGPHRRSWLDRLERDHDNLRAAHDWAVSNQDAELAMRLVVALWRFWHMRGFLQEGRRRAEDSLALPADQPTPLRARALQAAGGVAHWQHDVESQAAFYDEAISLWRELGDQRGLVDVLYDRLFAYSYTGGMEAGIEPGEKVLALAEEIGDPIAIAKAKWFLSYTIAFGVGDFPRAESLAAESMKTFRDEEDAFLQLWGLHVAGTMALARKRVDEAEAHFREGLRLAAEAMDVTGILFQLDNLSAAARARGDGERAIRLAAVASALKASSGTDLVDSVKEQTGIATIGREALTEDRLRELWTEAEGWSLEEAISYALETSS
jgi:predicted ATPase/class 3 adenylate cyclase